MIECWMGAIRSFHAWLVSFSDNLAKMEKLSLEEKRKLLLNDSQLLHLPKLDRPSEVFCDIVRRLSLEQKVSDSEIIPFGQHLAFVGLLLNSCSRNENHE